MPAFKQPLTKDQLFVLLDKYTPKFREHGMECEVKAQVFAQTVVHAEYPEERFFAL